MTELFLLAVFIAIASSVSDEEFMQLAKQLEMQQFQSEEFIRSQGDSGVKHIRHRSQGNRIYHGETHVGSNLAGMHNHDDWEKHVGSGEFEAVLNGVSFKTRHNDFQLRMPSRTSSEFMAVEEIPFPPVPPEVTNKSSVADQVKEMREWFKAWRDSDTSERDYRPYFKPVLCYLEGMWTTQTGRLIEMFYTDRHFTDARTWPAMHDNSMYMAATGTKSRRENFANCPTKIYDIQHNSTKLSQWLYRIVCHPLKKNVDVNRFIPIDELANRVPYKRNLSELYKYSSTRFRLSVDDTPSDDPRFLRRQLIDELMEEIPGLNNYNGTSEIDGSFGIRARKYIRDNKPSTEVLNTAYYHRLYSDYYEDAMSNYFKTRGYADENLFMAKTSQEQVIPTKTRHCPILYGRRRPCTTYVQRWSYAIPLEIIYMTPLNKWNPYKVTYRGYFRSGRGRRVKAGRRHGRWPARAFNGANSQIYALTPAEMFSGTDEVNTDPADTPKLHVVYVLGGDGKAHKVRYSGIRILFPEIPGVGLLRQRFPIMPIYGDGNPIKKELEALKALILDKYST